MDDQAIAATLEAVQRYREAGLVPMPVPAGTKRMVLDRWPELPPDGFAFAPGDSIALRLDGLLDVDLDCDEAAQLAVVLLPPTAWRSGRESVALPTHHWWLAPAGAVFEVFRDVDKTTLVEFRTGQGHYTMAHGVLPADHGRPAGPVVAPSRGRSRRHRGRSAASSSSSPSRRYWPATLAPEGSTTTCACS